jgi:parallel beta-helix repeat protein
MAVNHCNITNSGTWGIYTTYSDGKGGFVTFDNNTISSTVKFGLVIHAMKVSTIGTGNVFTSTKGVSIFGSYNSTTAQTWKNLNVPYIVSTELDIDGNLTIEPGTTFKFESNGWIEVGYFAVTTFIADGTAAAPITFTSNTASPVAGAWKGIIVYEKAQTNTKMNYCVIDYAGSTAVNRGALHMSGAASIIFTNNIIRNSSNYGIDLEGDAGFETFTNNTITNCTNHVIVISTEHLPDLGSPNTLTAATGKGILVSGDVNYEMPVTWKKQTADFYISGGSTDVDGIVTIEAGSKFMFVNDSYFWFGYYTNTKITAIGTSTSKIVFTTASLSPAAGTWKGLYFDDNVQTNSELAYCEFKYSGMTSKPAIYVNTSFPVSNTSITNFSSAHAAEYKTGITMPSGTGNDFTWFAN